MILPLVELAQIQNNAITNSGFGALKTGQGGLGFLVSRIYSLALIAAGIGFFVFLIIGGLRWILAGGDKAGLEAARNSITNAAIGLIIVVAAYAITKIIEVTLGLKIL